jgi:hypothetical protein
VIGRGRGFCRGVRRAAFSITLGENYKYPQNNKYSLKG